MVPLAATFMYLHHQKSVIRKTVKRQIIASIDRNELALLKFTEQESRAKLRWEHSKEFEFRGQMYDVVEKKIKGDTLYYWCWWDHEETRLNKQLNEMVAKVLGTSSQKKDSQEKLVEFYKNLYCNSHATHLVSPKEPAINHLTYFRSYTSVCHFPPVPPPRFS